MQTLAEKYKDMDYYDIPCLSYSTLNIFSQSPEKYHAWKNGEIKKSTKALEFGQSLHLALFEPERLQEVVKRYKKKNGKGMKVDYYKIIAMSEKIRNSEIYKIIDGGLWEHPCFFNIDGEDFKCKFDCIRPDLRVVVDMKKTRSCNPKSIINSVLDYRYHTQEVIYREGAEQNSMPIDTFIFLFIEEEPPHKIRPFILSDAFREKAAQLVFQDIANYKRHKELNIWRDEEEDLYETLELPKWAY